MALFGAKAGMLLVVPVAFLAVNGRNVDGGERLELLRAGLLLVQGLEDTVQVVQEFLGGGV